MKKILLLAAAVGVLVSCNKSETEYVLTGTIEGIADGKTVIIEVQDSLGQLKPIDTAKIEKGKFTFKGVAKEPAMHLIQVEGTQGKVPFILENGDIEMTINKDSIQNTKVKGTYNNDELTNYKDAGMKIQKKMMKYQQDNMMKMQQAQQSQDTVAMNSIRKEYGAFQDEFMKQSEDYVTTHPKAFITALIVDGMFNQMTPDVTKIKKFYDTFDAELKATKIGKAIKRKFDQMNKPVAEVAPAASGSAAIGSIAPDFSAPATDGKPLSLNASLGKVTIIDFWASWCKPCREENPNVVALYNELHAKGLNIIGVSLDKDAAAWKAAIAKDKLTWNQISNLKFWEEPIAATYGVQSIPATFILDATGKIVAKDLRGDALKAKVTELLAAK
jgi:peroxiredoxin